MTTNFERIMVAVDGSPAADAALDAAAALSAATSAEVIVAHVVHIQPSRLGVTHESDAEANDVITAAVDRVNAAGGRTGTTVLRSEDLHGVAWDLLDTAKDVNADLLCVGTTGRGPWRGAILGSVSHRVVQHSPCPVLVVPAAKK